MLDERPVLLLSWASPVCLHLHDFQCHLGFRWIQGYQRQCKRENPYPLKVRGLAGLHYHDLH